MFDARRVDNLCHLAKPRIQVSPSPLFTNMNLASFLSKIVFLVS